MYPSETPTEVARFPRERDRFVWKDQYTYYLLILPAVAYIVILSFYPAALAVYKSFFSPHGVLGLSNYQSVVSQGLGTSIVDTVIVSLGALAIQFFHALGIAVVLTKKFAGKAAFSTIMILPFGVATVVSAFIFSTIFSAVGGFANSFLRLLGLHAVNWYYSRFSEMGVVMFSDSWKNTPLVALIMLSGLSSLSPTIQEAALIDGAGPARRFWHVILPNVKSTLAIAMMIRGVSEFNIFALPLVLIGYHPILLTTLVYQNYNLYSPTIYYAYAAAVILLIFILAFASVILVMGGVRQYEAQ
ncbi:ABC transporter permease [Thermogymnomonas acidicola]|uniref:ABC transporter permease n=1 Tax=Thermogymnomonas acidicola TaxID=399579 RepID=A0AA37F9M5_9ARCH|nr:sugar ABC transporter permease [Thermogymnomonas acidicola]GGM70336.1 ABC transporter permease [Thermogymnomonas acidicola]